MKVSTEFLKPKSLLKITVAFVWCLVAAEFFLRVFHPIPMLPRYIQATEFGIRGNMPSETYQHQTPDYVVELRTNSKGVRADSEIPYEKPDGVYRVVLLGDSFAMGYGVNLENTFIEKMKAKLGDQLSKKIEIVNLAVSGFGTAEAMVMLENEGFKYQPDLVISTWHRSDLNDNSRSKLYEIKDRQIVRGNKEYLPGVKVREFLFQYQAYRWLAGESHLYNFYREFIAKQAKELLVELRKKPPKKKKEPQVTEPQKTESKPDRHQILTAAILEKMHQACKAKGSEFMILSIPRRLERTKFVNTFLSHGEKEKYGWHVVNVLPYLEKSKGEDVVLYWENSHGHFTPLGCDLVGQALADYVLKHGVLK